MQRTYPDSEKMTSMQWWIALRKEILREFPQALEDAGRVDEKGNSAPVTDAGFLLREAIRGGYLGAPEDGKEFTEEEKKCNAIAQKLRFSTVGLTNEGPISAEINKQFRARFGSISLPQLSSEEDKKADSTKVMKIFLDHLRRYHKVEKGIGFSTTAKIKRSGAKGSFPVKLNLNITTKCAEIWLIGIPLQEVSLAVDAIHTAAITGTAPLQTNPVLTTTPTTEFKSALYGLAEYEGATTTESKFPEVAIANINFATATPDGQFVGKALAGIRAKEDDKSADQALDTPEAVKIRLLKEFAKFQQIAKHAIEAAQLSLDTETKAADVANAMEAFSYIEKIKLFPEEEEASYPNITKATTKFKAIIDAFYTRKMDVLRQHTPMPIMQQMSEEHKQVTARLQAAEAQDTTARTILSRIATWILNREVTWEDTAPSKPFKKQLDKINTKLNCTKQLENIVNGLLREVKGIGTTVASWQEGQETVRITVTEDEYKRILDQIDFRIDYPAYPYLDTAFSFTVKQELTVQEKVKILREQAKAIFEDKIKKVPNPPPPTATKKAKALAYSAYEASSTKVYSAYASIAMFAKPYLATLPSFSWNKKKPTEEPATDDKKDEAKEQSPQPRSSSSSNHT